MGSFLSPRCRGTGALAPAASPSHLIRLKPRLQGTRGEGTPGRPVKGAAESGKSFHCGERRERRERLRGLRRAIFILEGALLHSRRLQHSFFGMNLLPESMTWSKIEAGV